MFWLKPIEIIYHNYNPPAKAGGNELPQAELLQALAELPQALACGG